MTLHEWGLKHGSDKATAHNYLTFYEQRIGEPKSILEFGVLNGASLKMWKARYPEARVTGFDLNPNTVPNSVVADCTDPGSISLVKTPIDLIIDDASHNTKDQILSFYLWWPMVAKGGHYVIEDFHTCFYTHYNPTKIDFLKWVKELGINHEIYCRMGEDMSDSCTVIFYK